jgi:hypothetical protein
MPVVELHGGPFHSKAILEDLHQQRGLRATRLHSIDRRVIMDASRLVLAGSRRQGKHVKSERRDWGHKVR